jgi:hypothetical protein
LFAIVLLGTPVRSLGSVEQEVHTPDRVDRRRGPDPQIAAQQRRGTLARELGDQSRVQPGVLRIEMLGAEPIRQSDDLLDVGPQRARNLEAIGARPGRTISHGSSSGAS